MLTASTVLVAFWIIHICTIIFIVTSLITKPYHSSISSFSWHTQRKLLNLRQFSDPKSVQSRWIDQSKFTSDVPHSFCHYEKAIGHFKESHSQVRKPDSNWVWIGDEKECPVEDYIGSLVSRKVLTSDEPLNILFIGDSLDRHLVTSLCSLLPSTTFPFSDEHSNNPDDLLANTGPAHENAVRLCKSGAMTIAHFKIFGMKKPCDNGGLVERTDDRPQHTTAMRIREYLPHDVLQHLNGGPIIAMIGSCLWDLSRDCTVSKNIEPGFLDEYTEGILENFQALQDVGVKDVFWRTCPPVTASYNDEMKGMNWGRTRENQMVLNQRLVHVVENNNIGHVVDWWQMMSSGHVPERNIDMQDGRHYGAGPGLAFLNMFFNALFYYHIDMKNIALESKEPVLPSSILSPKRFDDDSSVYPLEFVHITTTSGTAIEAAAAKAGIVWGACKFKRFQDHCRNLQETSHVTEHFRDKKDWTCKHLIITPWHCPLTEFKSGENLYQGSRTFTVVRNPYNRIISDFFYFRDFMYRSKYWSVDESGTQILLPKFDTPEHFNIWIAHSLDKVMKNGSCDSGHCIPMHKYTHNEMGEQLVDHILRLEYLSIEFPQLMETYGLPIGSLEQDNVEAGNIANNEEAPKRFGIEDLTMDTLTMINEWAKHDFRYFGYEMIVS
mmetsp:Transcript_8004/g.16354  ORF Transcript_8004/g.16354 Transcript_8004/m.16354 type:complete len:664 (+) Transcript_8004:104-2095(+)